ncbi:MAG TPA: hypothetical protein VHO48_05620, partial [Anaerolineaceae bacterium]|nr:hypothetical protein [Anaerolineaceae bacterium]
MKLSCPSVHHRLKTFAALFLILATLGCSATNALVQKAQTPAAAATDSQAKPGESTLQPTRTPESSAGGTVAPNPQPVGVAGERSIGDPYAPELGNTGYDVQMYTLRFAIDPAEINLAAHATIEALSTLANLGQISLDFTGFDIGQLTVNGAPAQYSREGDKLIVNFAAPLDQGEAFTLDVEYSGAPTFTTSEYLPFVDHLGLFFNTDTQRVFALSEPDGAHYWFPCNDHPRDKATYRFELTVPEEMTGLANGRLIETHTEVPNALPSGKAGDQFIWEHDFPMASYLATIGIGEYVLIKGTSPQGIPLRSYAY